MTINGKNRKKNHKGWILRLIMTLTITILLFGMQVAAVTLIPTEGGEAATMQMPEEADAEGQESDAEGGTEIIDDGFHSARLVDEADLLTPAEEAELVAKLDSISKRQQFDIVVLTVNSIGGKSPDAFADDYYD